ncbi:N-acetyltransferase [Actinospica durhamensis]|uniref:N-acetyltransferase n=1 Tax=Actinospica durhamensis TaxID=1508375 RepID=A0A941ELA5_9ACTN|nr:GNAT family N-acetyltransferase [Actinospica durhamensis]MBR7832973.1 N-acetyltransferase [Actinospica durhamensis]
MREIRAQHEENRYSAFIDGELVGHAACLRIGDAVAVPHVQVEPAFRDLGVGSELARSMCRDARALGLRVLALCPFMRRWGQLHPQYGDVLHAPRPGEVAAIAPFVKAAEFRERQRLRAADPGHAH